MTALSNAALADRIAALDWSGVSLQHQLAVTAACETLRNATVQDVLQAAKQIGLENGADDQTRTGDQFGVVCDQSVAGRNNTQVCGESTRGDSGIAVRDVFGRDETAVSNVIPLRGPSPELLRGTEYTPGKRVTLTTLSGAFVASALLARAERWDWIVETTCELLKCDVEQVGMVDDTVTVDGLPVFNC